MASYDRYSSRARGRYDDPSRSPSPTVVNSSTRSSSIASTVSIPREQAYGQSYDHTPRDPRQKYESVAKVGILVGAFAIIVGMLHLRKQKAKAQMESSSHRSRGGDRERRRRQRKEDERQRGQGQYDDWQERTNRRRIENGSDYGAPRRRIEYNDMDRASAATSRRSRR